MQQKAKIPDDHKRRLANELISELRSGKWEVRTCDILERSTVPIDTSASFKTIGAAKTDPHGSKRVLSFTVMPELALDMPKYLVAIDADGYDDARDWLYMYGLLEAFNTLLESRAYPFRPHMKGYGTNKQASMRRNEAVNPEASKAALMVLDYCVCETV